MNGHLGSEVGSERTRSDGGVAVPDLEDFRELSALPVDVWVGEGYVRRVGYGGTGRYELELWDFGVSLPATTWPGR